MDYSGYDTILIYKSFLKIAKKIKFFIIKSIKKRTLVAHLINNSHLKSFGNGVHRSLFKVCTLNNQHEFKK